MRAQVVATASKPLGRRSIVGSIVAATLWFRSLVTGTVLTAWRRARLTSIPLLLLDNSIDVLDAVRGLLEPLISVGPDSSIPLANRFLDLQVDDLEDQSEDEEIHAGLEETEYTKLPGIPKIRIERLESEIEDDFFLAIHVFMCELVDVRDFVSTQWEKYRKHAADITAVSLMSNTAIMMARRAEMALEAVLRPKKYPADTYPLWMFLPILMFHYKGVLGAPRMNLDKFSAGQWQEPADFASQYSDGIEEHCMWDAYKVILYAVHKSQPPPGRRGYSLGAANVDYKRMNGYPEKLSKLFEVFLKLQVVATCPEASSLAEDEVTRGIRIAIKTKTVPAWVSIGFQVLLDAQKHLGNYLEKPLQELDTCTAIIVDFAWDSIDKDRLYPPFGPRPPHIPNLEAFMNEMHYLVFQDGFSEAVRQGVSPLEIVCTWPHCLLEQNFYLKCNPVRYGLMEYNLYMQTLNKAMFIDMGLLVMTPLIHLYKALQLAYPDAPVWSDLEFLLKYQDIEHLFFGGLPKTFKEASNKYALSLGGSPTFFASDRRRGGFKMNPHKLRLVRSPALLGDILSVWFDHGPAAGVDIDDVTRDLFQFLNDPASFDKLAAQLDLDEEKKEEIRTLHPLPHQSIATMVNSRLPFIGAEDAIHLVQGPFNYLLLVEICNEVGNEIVRVLTDHGDNMNLTCYTIMMVLGKAFQAEEIATNLGLDVGDAVRKAPGMKRAHEIIQRLVLERGEECWSDVAAYSKVPRSVFKSESWNRVER